MFTALAERRAAQNALKPVWRNTPPPETPVPESEEGRRAAQSAALLAGRECFRVRDLYDAVRSVGRRVLVCPDPEQVAGDVAALVAMARDVCRRPAAVVAAPPLSELVRGRLAALGLPDGACDLGTRAAVRGDLDALAALWAQAGVRGVIVIACAQAPQLGGDLLAAGTVRTVIAVTDDRNAYPGDADFSPPELWPFAVQRLAHRGGAAVVAQRLREVWAARGMHAWCPDALTRPRDCVVCMEPCAGQCVSACCTAATCAGCAERWIASSGTCPGCRSPADYTTVHRVL